MPGLRSGVRALVPAALLAAVSGCAYAPQLPLPAAGGGAPLGAALGRPLGGLFGRLGAAPGAALPAPAPADPSAAAAPPVAAAGMPQAYRITPPLAAQIPGNVAGQINLLRGNAGLAPLTIDPQLSAAAAAHARDMSAQNRAWHFGSDGSSPLDRVRRQGYRGPLIGENISETFENEIATLSAWMQERDTRDIIMDPAARALGIGWFQEPTEKVWWVLLTGG